MNDSPLISISAPTCSRNFTRSDSNPLITRTRTVTMLFLVLPSLQLLGEEVERDVLLGRSLLWGFKAWNRRRC